MCVSWDRHHCRHHCEATTTCDTLHQVTPRGSGAHEDGMTYTDSEAYVSDTISDAPGARTDAPGTPDAGETTDDGCESPILCAHPARCAPPVLREPAPPAELSRQF
jgi:hypothetical protein